MAAIGRMIRKLIPAAGPVLSLTLIGVMMLSALLYYRAVRIQRFLEPSVAVSAPRITFYRKISNLIIEEFGSSEVPGLVFTGDQMLVHKSLLYQGADVRGVSPAMRKIGRIFYIALEDPEMRTFMESIIVTTRSPLTNDPVKNKKLRDYYEDEARFVLNALFLVEPGLSTKYPQYFESSVMSMNIPGEDADWIVFRLIPSERPNVEMMQKLRKYAH